MHENQSTQTETDVLVVRLRDEQYAIEPRCLQMVHRGTGLVPVPCAPPFVAGMLNVRGDVLTVLDLSMALGLGGVRAPDVVSPVLITDCSGARVGLLVDEALGMQRLALDQLDRSLSGRSFTRGIAGAAIVFLDLELLLHSGQLDVCEEVS